MSTLRNVYLVGGAVRDELLGIHSKDKDYVVVGSSITEMEQLGFVSIGKDFPVFIKPPKQDEYALARIERKIGQGYTGFSVDTGKQVSLEEDLSRRDLTINAIAQDQNGNIIDPFDGQQDLDNKILRHVTTAFKEDPVRVLRIARFRARFGEDWQIHTQTQELIQEMQEAGELDALVAERIWKETEKALGEAHPQLFFITLKELGVLQNLFPEIANMQNVPQPQVHHPEGDVFNHTMLVLKRSADLNFDIETRFAALTHDFGKPICHHTRGNLHGHEAEGVEVIEGFCARLKVSNKLRDLAVLTSRNHLLCHRFDELKPGTIYKLLIDQFNALKQPLRFKQFMQACQCDAQGRGETFVNRPYPQLEKGLDVLQALLSFDTKQVVAKALQKGKKGPEIGEQVKVAYIDCIKRHLNQTSARD